MKLFGSVTSPFVRRVRVVAAELGEAVHFVDTHLPAGEAQLRAFTPIWKIPAAEIEGETLFDSRVINEALIARHGWGPLRAPQSRDRNLLTVVDGVLDSAINWFYLIRRDKGDPNQPYVIRQVARVDSGLEWLANELVGASFSPDGGFGLPEIALASCLEWMDFRQVREVAGHPVFGPFVNAWANRRSMSESRPG